MFGFTVSVKAAVPETPAVLAAEARAARLSLEDDVSETVEGAHTHVGANGNGSGNGGNG